MAAVRSLEEATIADLSAAMAGGELTSAQLVAWYLERIATIDRQGPALNAVLEVNPDAPAIAEALDRERRRSGPRGPLHGIPVLLKDNINTGDRLHTSGASLALGGSFAPSDAYVARRLREAGAVILGKANMTELASFLTTGMPFAYSSRGGEVLNPYLPGRHTPSGSSSGCGVAVAANLTAVAVGTDTSGSVLCPANNNSIVGLRPTLGLVSRAGVLPACFSQDTAGPMARTVADVAALLDFLAGVDPTDAATGASQGRAHTDYTRFLDPDGLRGARIGVVRAYFIEKMNEAERAAFEAAVGVLRELGAVVFDPVEVPSLAQRYWPSSVFKYELKVALNAYLAGLGPGAPVKSVREMIAFNEAHAEEALRYGQVLLERTEATSGTLTEPDYLLDRLKDIRLARTEGIDAALDRDGLDALLFPQDWACWLPCRAGYPAINVPAGYTPDGKPFGITLTGRAWSEPTLFRLAFAYEQATRHRRPPIFE